LDDGQVERDDGFGLRKRQPAIKADAGASEVKVVVLAHQRAAGGGERFGGVEAVCDLPEGGELGLVGGVVRRVGAGEMRHDERGVLRHVRREIFGLNAQPVHAAVKLDAKGMAGQGLCVPGDLLSGVEHGREVVVFQQRRVACHIRWPCAVCDSVGAVVKGDVSVAMFEGALPPVAARLPPGYF